jgi:hypothetical protein
VILVIPCKNRVVALGCIDCNGLGATIDFRFSVWGV